MAIDKKTREAIERIHDGTLASQLKSNLRFVTSGVCIGVIIGVVVATFTGGNRIGYGALGAIAGGGMGYLTAPKAKKEPEEKKKVADKRPDKTE